MALNELLLGAAGARQGKVIFQNGKLRFQAGTAPAWTDYLTVDANGLVVLPGANAATSGLKFGSHAIIWSDSADRNLVLQFGGAAVLSWPFDVATFRGPGSGLILFSVIDNILRLPLGSANGQSKNEKMVTGTKSCVSGAGTETVSAVIPVGAEDVEVTIRITTILAGAGLTTISIGTTGDLTRWGTAIAIAADTTTTGADFTFTAKMHHAAAGDLIFTAAAGVFSSGVIRYTIHYRDLTAATS